MWWWTVAWGATCDGVDPAEACACEEVRGLQVSAALAAAGSGAVRRLSEGPWKRAAQSTCAWVDTLDLPADRCATTICARLVSEDRRATVASTPSAARDADLRRVTGRLCAPGDKTCATDARTTEEERLADLVEGLGRLGPAPVDAQRDWHVYRDGHCDAEAVAGAESAGPWTRAACGAVLAARRTDILAALASLRDPEAAEAIEALRWKSATRRLRPKAQPWRDWVDDRDLPAVRTLLREAVEARVDGALFPPLVSTTAWGRCVDPTALSCVEAVRAETRARVDAVRATPDPAELAWREQWCGDRPNVAAATACEAEVDLIVAAAAAAP